MFTKIFLSVFWLLVVLFTFQVDGYAENFSSNTFSTAGAEKTTQNLFYKLLEGKKDEVVNDWKKIIDENKIVTNTMLYPLSSEAASEIKQYLELKLSSKKNYFYFFIKVYLALSAGDIKDAYSAFSCIEENPENNFGKKTKSLAIFFKIYLSVINGKTDIKSNIKNFILSIGKLDNRHDWENNNLVYNELFFLYKLLKTDEDKIFLLKEFFNNVNSDNEYNSLVWYIKHNAKETNLLVQALIETKKLNEKSYDYYKDLFNSGYHELADSLLVELEKISIKKSDLLKLKISKAIITLESGNLKDSLTEFIFSDSENIQPDFLTAALEYYLIFNFYSEAYNVFSKIYKQLPENEEFSQLFYKLIFNLNYENEINAIFSKFKIDDIQDAGLYLKYLNFLLSRDKLDEYIRASKALMDMDPIDENNFWKLQHSLNVSIESITNNLVRLNSMDKAIEINKWFNSLLNHNRCNYSNDLKMIFKPLFDKNDSGQILKSWNELELDDQDFEKQKHNYPDIEYFYRSLYKLVKVYLYGDTNEIDKLEEILMDAFQTDELYQVYLALIDKYNMRQRAYNFLEKLCGWYKYEDRPYIWLGYLNYQDNNFTKAKQLLEEAIKIDPSDGDQYYSDRLRAYKFYAMVLRKLNIDIDKAQIFESAVKAVEISNQADMMAANWDVKGAIEKYNIALGIFKPAYCILARLAKNNFYLGNIEEARKNYNDAFNIMPSSFAQWVSACFGCEGLFNHKIFNEDAVKIYSEKIITDPDNPALYYLRGNSYLDISYKLKDKALEDFKKTIDLDKSYINAYIKVLSIYQSKNDYESELQTLNKLIENAPYYSKFYKNYIEFSVKSGRFDLLYPVMKKLYSINPKLAVKILDKNKNLCDFKLIDTIQFVFSIKGLSAYSLMLEKNQNDLITDKINYGREDIQIQNPRIIVDKIESNEVSQWIGICNIFLQSQNKKIRESAVSALKIFNDNFQSGATEIPEKTLETTEIIQENKINKTITDKLNIIFENYFGSNSYTSNNPQINEIAELGESALPFLFQHLNHSDWAVKELAKDGIIEIIINTKKPWELTKPHLKNQDLTGEIIAKLELKEAAADLEKLLSEIKSFNYYNERIKAAVILNLKGIIPNFMTILKKSKSFGWHIGEGIKAIKELGGKELLPELQNFFEKSSKRVNKNEEGGLIELIEAMHSFGDTEAHKKLVPFLNPKQNREKYFIKQVNDAMIRLTSGHYYLEYNSPPKQYEKAYSFWREYLGMKE